nr:cyclomaltodextrinase N-terminal domain-containing protein [Acidobacteriota bacterium]
MKNKLHHFIFLLLIAYCSLLTANAQTPTVEKIDPPNWWANMTVNPVRVLVRGKNLSGAHVFSPLNSGLKAYNFRHSDNGHYLFFDVEIAPNTKAGKYNFKIETKNGFVNAPFEISARIL